MNKLLLPISISVISFLLFPTFSPRANAQPKNITCEEWKNIVGTDKCKYAVVTSTVIGDAINPRRDPPNSIWCANTVDISETYINLPMDYEYTTSDEQCIYDVMTDYYSQPQTQQPEIPKQETKSSAQSIDDWIMENNLISDPARIEQMETERNELYRKTAELQEVMFEKAQQVWQSEMIKLQAESLVEPKFEFLWEGQWPNVKTVVFDTGSGAIIKSDSWQNIYLQDLADEVTKKVVLRQGEMEIKVINANPTQNKVSVQVDDFFDIFVIQTHFRVEYDPDKKLAQVDVYEGQVEVRTKDGKTVKVVPNGDKPGVLVVTKKLSLIKLSIIVTVLAVIIGGTIFFLKNKKRK